ncbi:hypothetical protein FN846DRAFT_469430 [Sphaerosporella brunnea]|uniref:Uncharacterized protein n=1 Tax=Sphaerosporella brunnea TaxID=1250544 RepID=A0A5J5EE38_9PEZI|nr:hypothetical protein FN846DRAFT_469430 [Sphaerosporella brunnea]
MRLSNSCFRAECGMECGYNRFRILLFPRATSGTPLQRMLMHQPRSTDKKSVWQWGVEKLHGPIRDACRRIIPCGPRMQIYVCPRTYAYRFATQLVVAVRVMIHGAANVTAAKSVLRIRAPFSTPEQFEVRTSHPSSQGHPPSAELPTHAKSSLTTSLTITKKKVVRTDKRCREVKRKTTVRGIPTWSPTIVLTSQYLTARRGLAMPAVASNDWPGGGGGRGDRRTCGVQRPPTAPAWWGAAQPPSQAAAGLGQGQGQTTRRSM